jgi:putative inorganic carbon (HCO3(-)) transporter
MTSWKTTRQHEQAGRGLAAHRQGLAGLTGQHPVLQWAVVGLVGVALGICTLCVSSLPSKWAPVFVLAVLCPFIAMIVGGARRLLLAIIILDIPFRLDIHLGYRATAAQLGALGGLSISITTLSLVMLYGLWLAELLTKPPDPRSRPLFATSLPSACYLAFGALSLVAARDVMLSIFQLSVLLQTFLLYVYIVGTVRTRQDVLFIVAMLCAGLALEGLIMIGLGVVGQDFSIAGISSRIELSSGIGGRFYRVSGTVGSPATAASYLSLLLAPALSLLVTRLDRGYKWLGLLAFILGGGGLILTFTRGGWLTFALSMMILCLLSWRRGWLPPAILVGVPIVLVLLSVPFYGAVFTRLANVGTVQSRVPLMELALRIIMDNPLLGVGVNNFPIVMAQYATLGLSGAWLYAVHNKYLLVWAETGVGGLVAFMWFLLATIRHGWQGWKLSDRTLSPLALGCTAAVVGQMAHMLVDIFNTRPQIQLLWLVAGLIAAIRNVGGDDG